MSQNPTPTAVRDPEHLHAPDDLVGGAVQVLTGAQRMRRAAENDGSSHDELLETMTILLASLGELGDSVEATRRRLPVEPRAAGVERRVNELASALHGARHNAALVSRALKGEPAPVIVPVDGVDLQGQASFPASDPPGWWAGR